MKLLAIFCALLQAAPSVSTSIARIRTKLPVEDISSVDAAHLAGVFKNPGKSLVKTTGGFLAGDILYLFPDGTYVYVVWTDVAPDSIYDKGVWTYSPGLVQLVSDPDVKWNPGIDRRLIFFRRPSKRDEVLLFEEGRLPDFEENAGKDPESILITIAMERSRRLKVSEVPKLKASLIKRFWDPEVHGHS